MLFYTDFTILYRNTINCIRYGIGSYYKLVEPYRREFEYPRVLISPHVRGTMVRYGRGTMGTLVT